MDSKQIQYFDDSPTIDSIRNSDPSSPLMILFQCVLKLVLCLIVVLLGFIIFLTVKELKYEYFMFDTFPVILIVVASFASMLQGVLICIDRHRKFSYLHVLNSFLFLFSILLCEDIGFHLSFAVLALYFALVSQLFVSFLFMVSISNFTDSMATMWPSLVIVLMSMSLFFVRDFYGEISVYLRFKRLKSRYVQIQQKHEKGLYGKDDRAPIYFESSSTNSSDVKFLWYGDVFSNWHGIVYLAEDSPYFSGTPINIDHIEGNWYFAGHYFKR